MPGARPGCEGARAAAGMRLGCGVVGVGGPGIPGRGQGRLTESHLIHGPLFLHAGHRRRLLLILCGQRTRMKPRGAPWRRGRVTRPAGVRRRAWGSEGPRRGGASPPAGSGPGPSRQSCAHSPLFFFQGETSPGERQ